MKLVIAAILVTALPFAIASADRRPPHPPPQEAIDACAKSRQGDTCSVAFHDHTLAGTCEIAPDTSTLACRPDRPPPHQPPPEALAACDGGKEGDACSFNHGDHAIVGSCAKSPDGNGPLACRPTDPPPHH